MGIGVLHELEKLSGRILILELIKFLQRHHEFGVLHGFLILDLLSADGLIARFGLLRLLRWFGLLTFARLRFGFGLGFIEIIKGVFRILPFLFGGL